MARGSFVAPRSLSPLSLQRRTMEGFEECLEYHFETETQFWSGQSHLTSYSRSTLSPLSLSIPSTNSSQLTLTPA